MIVKNQENRRIKPKSQMVKNAICESRFCKLIVETRNSIWNGIKDIIIQETPNLKNQEIFKIASPILIKRTIGIKEKYYFYNDDESDKLMTETMVSKMKKAGLNDNE